MIMRFKQYLNETATGPELMRAEIDIDKLVDIIEKKCKQSLWRIEENVPIFRGERNLPHGNFLIDPSKTERKSSNTTNYYTLIFDNHPQMKNWPKRSRSLICTDSYENASGYGKVLVVIPLDSTKNIASVNSRDSWDAQVTLYNHTTGIPKWNRFFSELNLNQSDWSGWEKFDASLKTNNKLYSNFKKCAYDVFGTLADIEDDDRENFLSDIFTAYDPKVLGFSLHKLSDPSIDKHSEYWFSGPCVAMPIGVWDTLKTKIKN